MKLTLNGEFLTDKHGFISKNIYRNKIKQRKYN